MLIRGCPSARRLALSALSTNNPKTVLTQRAALIADQQVFNIQIPFEGAPITNQRSSGRCWLFASTNVFRVAIMKKYNIASFELSQAYLFFWDKLEKANFFLENVIDTADEDLEGRLVQTLLAGPVSDGGQWDMGNIFFSRPSESYLAITLDLLVAVYNLVNKYGLVPQVLYPDSWNAMSSATLNSIVVSKLREYALTLRKLLRSSTTTAASLAATKQKMMREIHLILTLTLGPPPSATEKFGKFSSARGTTPSPPGLGTLTHASQNGNSWIRRARVAPFPSRPSSSPRTFRRPSSASAARRWRAWCRWCTTRGTSR